MLHPARRAKSQLGQRHIRRAVDVIPKVAHGDGAEAHLLHRRQREGAHVCFGVLEPLPSPAEEVGGPVGGEGLGLLQRREYEVTDRLVERLWLHVLHLFRHLRQLHVRVGLVHLHAFHSAQTEPATRVADCDQLGGRAHVEGGDLISAALSRDEPLARRGHRAARVEDLKRAVGRGDEERAGASVPFQPHRATHREDVWPLPLCAEVERAEVRLEDKLILTVRPELRAQRRDRHRVVHHVEVTDHVRLASEDVQLAHWLRRRPHIEQRKRAIRTPQTDEAAARLVARDGGGAVERPTARDLPCLHVEERERRRLERSGDSEESCRSRRRQAAAHGAEELVEADFRLGHAALGEEVHAVVREADDAVRVREDAERRSPHPVESECRVRLHGGQEI
mmetsp:Transcript_25095/g.62190  ORF Transcript_25095/g.62190 Transcript_25095/m.62190 type:complete len:394 (+) Transcript_25095:270-1451(+)